MTTRKKLIEVALPLEAINVASVRENYIYRGNPSAMHKWWAQRPLAAARAMIFASLVDDPDSSDALPAFVEACKQLPIGANVKANGDTPRMRLFDFIERLVTWEATTDEDILNIARELIQIATEGNPPPLLDPFAGGGSIPLEAQRLGLEAHASDLNPVAVMINKGLIEIPQRFANMPPINAKDQAQMVSHEGWKGAAGLAADVRYYGEWIGEKAWERIGHLYPTHNGETVIAWLWARTVKCPNPACGAQMPLLTSFDLSTKASRKVWVKPLVDQSMKSLHLEIETGQGKGPTSPKVGRGAKFRCLVCNQIAGEDSIRREFQAKRQSSQMITIVTDGLNGRKYHSPTVSQIEIALHAKPNWKPLEEMNQDTPSLVSGRGYGFSHWHELFTDRQLHAITTLSDLVSEVRDQAYQDARNAGLPDETLGLQDGGLGARSYAEAISTYLGFALNKYATYGCSFAVWYSKEDRPKAIFATQAIPMVWDYVEINPFSEIGGSFKRSVEIVADSIPNTNNAIRGQAIQSDVANLSQVPEDILISTDPPYYDNIDYAELSDFFYIWLRRTLQQIYPKDFGTMLTPKLDFVQKVVENEKAG